MFSAEKLAKTVEARWFLPAALLFIFGLQGAIRYGGPLNIDSSWYLIVARRVLGGETLYRDIFEVNPPFGMWFSVPAAWFSLATGIAGSNSFVLFVILIAAISLLMTHSVLLKVDTLGKVQKALFLCASAFALLFLPGADFGQREHIISLLFLPWVIVRFSRLSGFPVNAALATCSGILLALAVMLKPHVIFAPFLVECVVVYRSRKILPSLSIENLVAAFAAALCVSIIWLSTPLFMQEMIQLGVKAYVPFYGESLLRITLIAGWFMVLFIAAALSLAAMRPSPLKQLGLLFLAAGLGFGLSYAVQLKGSPYHLVPAIVFCALALASSLLAGRSPLVIAGPVLLAALLYTQPMVPSTADRDKLAEMIDRHAPGAKSFLVASTVIGDWLPYAEVTGKRWASSMPGQWLAPYVKSRMMLGDDANDPIVLQALSRTVDDLVREQPDIIFVDVSRSQKYMPGGSFDYLQFWSRDSRFGPFWQQYRDAGLENGVAVFVRE
jgi:hypothetical protein